MRARSVSVSDTAAADPAPLSPFQAFMTALGASVGTGNIAGVAGAIISGGPGALFWIWVYGWSRPRINSPRPCSASSTASRAETTVSPDRCIPARRHAIAGAGLDHTRSSPASRR
jgi:hypothetical protein